MWNAKFVSIRNFEPKRDTAMHGFLNRSDIHRGIVAACGRVVNTAAFPKQSPDTGCSVNAMRSSLGRLKRVCGEIAQSGIDRNRTDRRAWAESLSHFQRHHDVQARRPQPA